MLIHALGSFTDAEVWRARQRLGNFDVVNMRAQHIGVGTCIGDFFCRGTDTARLGGVKARDIGVTLR